MGRTDGRVCCFRITPLCKLSRHSRFQTGICFNYPDGARSCATLFSLNLPLIEWETRWEARERGGRGDECARGVFGVFRCGWDKSITDKLVNVDPVKKEIWQLFYRVSCWHPTISSWSHSGVFFLECRRFFFVSFPLQNWLQRKKNPSRPKTFLKQISVEEKVCKLMRTCAPVLWDL